MSHNSNSSSKEEVKENQGIVIVDAVMGTGKSTWVIEEAIRNHNKKYVIVVPLLAEVERYETKLKEHRPVYAPHVDINSPDVDSKLEAFKRALLDGAGVVITTHALFSLWDDESRKHIANQGGYTLILDETVDPVQEADIKKDDYQLLLNCGYIREEAYPLVTKEGANFKAISRTEKTAEYSGKLNGFIRHALRNNIISLDDSKYIQTLKPENVSAFDQSFVLTYLFPGSQMDCWLRLYGLDVVHKTLIRDPESEELVLADHPGLYSGVEFADKIKIIETPEMNEIGAKGKRRRGFPLSNEWFRKATPETLKRLREHLGNMSRHIAKKFAREVVDDDTTHQGYYFMWSVKNDFRTMLEKGGMRYKTVPPGASLPFEDEHMETEADRQCFLAHNQRATNKFAHKGCLAYLTTPLPIVPIKQFFAGHGLDYNDETFMLSTLLQWVWRSRIRNGEEILVYIPSEPLRELFTDWLSTTV